MEKLRKATGGCDLILKEVKGRPAHGHQWAFLSAPKSQWRYLFPGLLAVALSWTVSGLIRGHRFGSGLTSALGGAH